MVSASVWVGGLVAVLAHAMRGGANTDIAARRFSVAATISIVVIGISGVVNAWVRVPVSDLFTTTYGRLVLAKAAALLVLGAIGYLQRRARCPRWPPTRATAARSSVSRAGDADLRRDHRAGRRPRPDPAAAGPTTVPTPVEVQFGYNLAGPPTVSSLRSTGAST